jgi:hypothetical protein
MQTIADSANQPLIWMRRRFFKADYELRTRDTVVATLRFRGIRATAESAEGTWTFQPKFGIWRSETSIRVHDAAVELAVFRHNLCASGGMLMFNGGPKFKATRSFWMAKYEFRTEAGEPLVRLLLGGVFWLSAQVQILPAARAVVEVPLLVLFGWYWARTNRADS